jgi:hypothetical protein
MARYIRGCNQQSFREETMHRLSLASAALCAALMAGAGAFAQAPPPSENPNDAVPDVMPFDIPIGDLCRTLRILAR